MKIEIETDESLREPEVIVRCAVVDDHIVSIVAGLRMHDRKMTGDVDGEMRVVAVGEIGLDHHWPVPRQEQYDLFEAQLQLAKELDLPVSVHDREAHAEMYELLRKYKPRGALHCYSGSAEDAVWLVEQGLYLGFGGAVTYKGAKRAAKVLAAIPHERALLETDCPYMAPEPVRGTRNDSRNIAHVAAYIGTIWDMDAQAVLDVTAENARTCFGV